MIVNTITPSASGNHATVENLDRVRGEERDVDREETGFKNVSALNCE